MILILRVQVFEASILNEQLYKFVFYSRLYNITSIFFSNFLLRQNSISQLTSRMKTVILGKILSVSLFWYIVLCFPWLFVFILCLNFLYYQFCVLITTQKFNKSKMNTEFNIGDYEVKLSTPKKSKKKRLGIYSFDSSNIIGSGYSSKVYVGARKSQNAQQKVAIKQITLKNIDNLHYSLLKNETKIVKRLSSSNVIKVHEVIVSKNNCYIIMEFCSGGTLEGYIHKNKVSSKEKIGIMEQLMNGLKYLASEGIIHRDIKPANILLGDDKQWKIADFGFSIEISDQIDKSVCVGSPLYMAPEVSMKSEYSFKSDMFSLGLVFYQIIHNGSLPRRQLLDSKHQNLKIAFRPQSHKISRKKYGRIIEFEEDNYFDMDCIRNMLQEDPKNRIDPFQLNTKMLKKKNQQRLSPPPKRQENKVKIMRIKSEPLIVHIQQSDAFIDQEEYILYQQLLPSNKSRILPLLTLLQKIKSSKYLTCQYVLQEQVPRRFAMMIQKHIQLLKSIVHKDNPNKTLIKSETRTKKFCQRMLDNTNKLLQHCNNKLSQRQKYSRSPLSHNIELKKQITYLNLTRLNYLNISPKNTNTGLQEIEVTNSLRDSIANYKDFLQVLLQSKSRNDMKIANVLSMITFREKILFSTSF